MKKSAFQSFEEKFIVKFMGDNRSQQDSTRIEIVSDTPVVK